VCPFCKRLSLSGWKVYNGEGQVKKWYHGVYLPNDSVECPACAKRWPIYKTGLAARTPEPEAEALVFDGIDESRRSTVSRGSEERLIDHSETSAHVRKTITFSRRWTQTFTTESESTWTVGSGVTLGLGKLSAFKASAESKLRERYAVAVETSQTHQEELVIEIPPAKKILIVLDWKEVFQHGVIYFQSHDERVGIPFAVSVGLTFDQRQRDVA
jgi:hypothetical protein